VRSCGSPACLLCCVVKQHCSIAGPRLAGSARLAMLCLAADRKQCPSPVCRRPWPQAGLASPCNLFAPRAACRSLGASAGAELAAELAAAERAVHAALASALEVKWPVSRWPIYVFTGAWVPGESSGSMCACFREKLQFCDENRVGRKSAKRVTTRPSMPAPLFPR
jgi:hypothetical protein